MAVYRFRVSLEDNEDVYRDIDVKVAQDFEEFHKTIQEAFKFDGKHAASFFVSDDYWRKNQEITLRKEDLPLDEDEIRKNVEPKKLMKDTKIAKYIEQPHQRFIYVFDPTAQWTFLIEMLKIAEASPKQDYPAVVKSAGVAPKQYKQVNVAKEEPGAGLSMAALLGEDEEPGEEDIREIDPEIEAVEDDDIVALEGEEGEEGGEEDAQEDMGFEGDPDEEI